MVALISFLLNMIASLFKSKSRLEAENAALRHQLIVLQRKVRGRVPFPAHMGCASSWPNALADRELLSWLCLQTRFRQILEGARIVDRLVAKLLQRFSGKRRAPT